MQHDATRDPSRISRRTTTAPSLLTAGALIAALVFGAAMPPAAAATGDPGAPAPIPGFDSGPVRIIEAIGNVFTKSTQENTAVDITPGGRILLTWDSRRQEAGTSGVYARALDALGRPLSQEVHVNRTLRGQQRLPAVACAGDDAVWFTWDSSGHDGQAGSIVARRFHADLRPAGPEIALNDGRPGDPTRPAIAGFPDGSAIVAWMTTLPGPGARTAVRARRLGSDGRVDGGEIAPGNRSEGRDALPSIAPLPGGRALVVWARSGAGATRDGIFGRILDAGGRPEGEEIRISPEDGRTHIEPAVATDARGRSVVGWLAGVDDGYAVMARRLDSGGTPSDDARTIAVPSTGWKSGVAVAAAPDGRFVVSFNSDGEDGDGEGVFTRFFDAAGRERSAARVNRRWAGGQAMTVASGARRVAWSPLGILVHAWSGDSGAGDPASANVTILTPERLEVAAAPDLGEPRMAPRVTSDEFLAANPPIWDPDFEPIAPLPRDAVAGGDFGFEAVTYTGWTPPDPEMAVGPADIVVITNGEISTFTRAGVNRWRDEIENSFGFWGELGANNFVFDPEVTWDPHARRFFAMAAERSDNFRSYFLLAVSKDTSPDDRNDWYKYRLDVTALAGNDIDSPNLAMNANSVLLTADFFAPDKYLIYIIDKASILGGGAPVTTSELISGTGQQSMGIPVVYDTGDPLYIVQSTEFTNNTQVILHAISNPFTAYTRQTFTLTVPAYQYPTPPPQKGTSSRPSVFEPRFWSVAERNGAIWAVHHVNSTRTRVRWYQFALNGWPATGAPSLAQWGEIDLGGQIYTYFPSIHVDAADNAAITFARSAPNEYISIGRTIHGASDPPGTFRPVQVVQTSANPHESGRWGDYSGTQADSDAPGTFWGHHEFTNGSPFSWRTWVARYGVRPEPMVLKVDPLVAGSTADLTVTGATPGNTVYFGYSLGGTALTEITPLNATVSLESPVPIGSVTADGSGTAVLTTPIPGGAAGLDVWIQALERSHTTNWVATTVQ